MEISLSSGLIAFLVIIFKVILPVLLGSGLWREERHFLPLLWLKNSFTSLSSRLWKETTIILPPGTKSFSDFISASLISSNSLLTKIRKA